MKLIMSKLFAPDQYWSLTPEARADATNGCGTRGIIGILVPDTIYGLCITPACNIHDWMYICGATLYDKDEADRVFLNNMLRLIDDGRSWKWLKLLRIRRAKIYYQAVRLCGGPAFWAAKNKPESLGYINE